MYKEQPYTEKRSIKPEDIDELYVLNKYLGVKKLPALINAPYRKDTKPSLGIQLRKGKVYFKDFAKNISGGLVDLLIFCWGCTFKEAMQRLAEDAYIPTSKVSSAFYYSDKQTIIKVQLKEWRDVDIKYWENYGCSMPYVKKYVIPIKYYWINDKLFKADNLAYAYPIKIGNRYHYKVYQPENKKWKWVNDYPQNQFHFIESRDNYEKIVICSSLKDALCLHSQCGVDVVAGQSERITSLPDDILIHLLKYKQIVILFDNDETGIESSKYLSEKYNFKNVIIPSFKGGKDISDYYKQYKNINEIWKLIQQQ